MKDKLKELEKDIKDKLTRLMEVSRGCLVKNLNITCEVIDIYGNKIFVFVPTHRHTALTKTGDCEIIGHPIILSDVLEWLQYSGIEHSILETVEINAYHNHETGNKRYSEWDLSKKHLHEQSEELINYLHSLIKKQ